MDIWNIENWGWMVNDEKGNWNWMGRIEIKEWGKCEYYKYNWEKIFLDRNVRKGNDYFK